jgi:hypothetical protein
MKAGNIRIFTKVENENEFHFQLDIVSIDVGVEL